MKFVNAHVHLSDEEYVGNVDKIVMEAKRSNVIHDLNSMDFETGLKSLELAERHHGIVYVAWDPPMEHGLFNGAWASKDVRAHP